jgi:hypothetical protein
MNRASWGRSDLIKLNQPKAVRVVARAGAPSLINGKRVEQILDRWRIDDTWWRDEDSRMYFDCLMQDHNTQTVFQDLVTKEWFSQRYGGMVPIAPSPPGWRKPADPADE